MATLQNSKQNPQNPHKDDVKITFDTYDDADFSSKSKGKATSGEGFNSSTDTKSSSKLTGSKSQQFTSSDPDKVKKGFLSGGTGSSGNFGSATRKEKIKKFILIGLVIFILILVGYILGSTMTDSLQKMELQKLRASNVQNEKLIASMSTNLTQLSKDYARLSKDYDATTSQLTDATSQLSQATNELRILRQSSQEAISVVRNSVQAVCCSFSDTQAGNALSWGIAKDKIICQTGENSVDCRTGVTTFRN
jgi:outer membrane murein-binding lipoprotein Lpp